MPVPVLHRYDFYRCDKHARLFPGLLYRIFTDGLIHIHPASGHGPAASHFLDEEEFFPSLMMAARLSSLGVWYPLFQAEKIMYLFKG